MTPLGFICEIYSGYQGEGGSVKGSCMGRRQIFVRFAGCNLSSGEMGTEGCTFCDSPHAKSKKLEHARIEVKPGDGKFKMLRNPIGSATLVDLIVALRTPDFHSVSLTGGEPLWQPEFLRHVASDLREIGMKTYLETNGSLPANLTGVSEMLNFACVDVKDKSAGAAMDWAKLLDAEIESVEILKEAGVSTFAKLVVTGSTDPDTVEVISYRLAKVGCPMAIQVVTPVRGVKRPQRDLLYALTEAAAKHLQPDELCISVQMHRPLKLP